MFFFLLVVARLLHVEMEPVGHLDADDMGGGGGGGCGEGGDVAHRGGLVRTGSPSSPGVRGLRRAAWPEASRRAAAAGQSSRVLQRLPRCWMLAGFLFAFGAAAAAGHDAPTFRPAPTTAVASNQGAAHCTHQSPGAPGAKAALLSALQPPTTTAEDRDRARDKQDAGAQFLSDHPSIHVEISLGWGAAWNLLWPLVPLGVLVLRLSPRLAAIADPGWVVAVWNTANLLLPPELLRLLLQGCAIARVVLCNTANGWGDAALLEQDPQLQDTNVDVDVGANGGAAAHNAGERVDVLGEDPLPNEGCGYGGGYGDDDDPQVGG